MRPLFFPFSFAPFLVKPHVYWIITRSLYGEKIIGKRGFLVWREVLLFLAKIALCVKGWVEMEGDRSKMEGWKCEGLDIPSSVLVRSSPNSEKYRCFLRSDKASAERLCFSPAAVKFSKVRRMSSEEVDVCVVISKGARIGLVFSFISWIGVTVDV